MVFVEGGGEAVSSPQLRQLKNISEKGKKRKTSVLHKNKKLSSVTLFTKLNIESEHINAINRLKNIVL